mgnify:CR=1 FL=1
MSYRSNDEALLGCVLWVVVMLFLFFVGGYIGSFCIGYILSCAFGAAVTAKWYGVIWIVRFLAGSLLSETVVPAAIIC